MVGNFCDNDRQSVKGWNSTKAWLDLSRDGILGFHTIDAQNNQEKPEHVANNDCSCQKESIKAVSMRLMRASGPPLHISAERAFSRTNTSTDMLFCAQLCRILPKS